MRDGEKEGYGCDWGAWDAWRRGRFADALAKLGEPIHATLEVFKSPGGRWMAFHSAGYEDLRVHDLASGDLVATNVYEKDGHYGHTVALSTYVPSFREGVEHGRRAWRPVHATGLEPEPEFEDGLLWSMPLAFHALTVWAADHEQYVETLDLSRIDDGIIAVVDREPLVMPIGMAHVRNHVQATMTYEYDMEPDPADPRRMRSTGTCGADRGHYVSRIAALVEADVGTARVAMGPSGRGASRLSLHAGPGRDDPAIPNKALLPWEEVAKISAGRPDGA